MIKHFEVFLNADDEFNWKRELLEKVAQEMFVFIEEVLSTPFQPKETFYINRLEKQVEFKITRFSTLLVSVKYAAISFSLSLSVPDKDFIEVSFMGDILHPEVKILIEYFKSKLNYDPKIIITTYFKIDVKNIEDRKDILDIEKYKDFRTKYQIRSRFDL